MLQLSLALPEQAPERIEDLLRQKCPAHPGTTLDGQPCPLCQLERERISPWVRQAEERRLPPKVF